MRLERQVGGAAQLEAAPGQQRREHECEGAGFYEPHQTTMLIRRPGTMMVLRIALPSMYFATAAAAMASAVFWSAAFGTLALPRVLPLTCTT